MAKKKSSKYWKDRFLELESASNRYGQEAFREIEPAFDKAQRRIQHQIEIWYSRVAKNNKISIEEAKKLLTTKELKEFRWDVEEYIKYGQENSFNQKWMKELENASARVHISRLEALKIRTQHESEVAFGNELDSLDAMARKVYTEDYYRSIFEMQKGFNIGWEIGEIDNRKLDKLIAKPWTTDDKTFKDRIWTAKQKMVSELHQQLTRTCILGKSPDEAIEAMTKYVDKDFKNAKYAAGRLVMTEQAYFHSVAQKDAFAELDVERVEIVATLDSHTSTICQDMDGEIVSMKDYEPGVTVPPFHVFCRSVTVPYFEDNFGGERAARDADGNTYYVPDDMTYKEWKEQSVLKEDASKIPITTITDASINRIKRIKIDGLSAEQCDAIQENHKKLLSISRDENDCNEVAFILSGDFKDYGTPYMGSNDKIEFPLSAFDNKQDVFVMHNHPRNKSFSSTDVFEFLKNDRIKYVSIVKNNGQIEVLTKLESCDKISSVKSLRRIIKDKVKHDLDGEYDNAVKAFLTKAEKDGVIKWLH